MVGLDKIDFEICGNEFVSTYSTVNSQITVLLDDHIKVNSAINNAIIFNINICPNLFHSNLIEPSQSILHLNNAGENIPNLPLAA